jgi:hypothetical protein
VVTGHGIDENLPERLFEIARWTPPIGKTLGK